MEAEKRADPVSVAHALHVSQGQDQVRGGHHLHSRLVELFFDFVQYSPGDCLLEGGELRQLTEAQA
jgi:hypothetical protein